MTLDQKPLRHYFRHIIGQSEKMLEVFSLVEKVADSDSTVLITGESGTGKELIAKAVHSLSHRKKDSFIAINCGAIPSELLESELFGHTRGAFTGAISNRSGRFEMADGGTIFLDEIGDLAPQLQVKLLRVLQERSFEPVGSTKSFHVDVRVVAATNKNLEELVQKGQFREDLFYRLNVIPIKVPSLRERKSDIPYLLHHFIQNLNLRKKRAITGISAKALEHLTQYPWPGNIRELENLVERLIILKGQGLIDTEDLPTSYQYLGQEPYLSPHIDRLSLSQIEIPDSGVDFNFLVDQFENQLLVQALEKTNWNRNQAAHLLNLNRTTLVEKIKKKGLKPSQLSQSYHSPQVSQDSCSPQNFQKSPDSESSHFFKSSDSCQSLDSYKSLESSELL
jgi:transcriptional regulator with GAF, ATPase, and Fis domain